MFFTPGQMEGYREDGLGTPGTYPYDKYVPKSEMNMKSWEYNWNTWEAVSITEHKKKVIGWYKQMISKQK